jgi:hypothetical protein
MTARKLDDAVIRNAGRFEELLTKVADRLHRSPGNDDRSRLSHNLIEVDGRVEKQKSDAAVA